MTAQPQVYHLFAQLYHPVPGLIHAMAQSWQLWLSPRPSQRTKIVQEATVLASSGDILYEFPMHRGLRAVRETHYLGQPSVREGKSGPPL